MDTNTVLIGDLIKEILTKKPQKREREGSEDDELLALLEIIEDKGEVAKKQNSHAKWTKETTTKFYEALTKYGPNFDQIHRVLPQYTRRQLLLKYRKERRYRPIEVQTAIELREVPKNSSNPKVSFELK